MLSLFISGACGFASVKVDPLCAACQITPEEAGGATGGMGTYTDLTPAGKEIMKRCVFTVFKECLADGLGENSFCETVVSESAALGWTKAEDHEHDKALECALTSPCLAVLVLSTPSYIATALKPRGGLQECLYSASEA